MSKYPRKSSSQRGYNAAWNKASKAYRVNNQLCVMCLKLGMVTASEVVDHIKPHKGDKKLFWDVKNWQALCKHCHDSVKQTIEKSGYEKGCDVSGMPLDVNHHWNRL